MMGSALGWKGATAASGQDRFWPRIAPDAGGTRPTAEKIFVKVQDKLPGREKPVRGEEEIGIEVGKVLGAFKGRQALPK
jgi:hypothetical protein